MLLKKIDVNSWWGGRAIKIQSSNEQIVVIGTFTPQTINKYTEMDAYVSMYSILCTVFSLLFAYLMCYLWVDAAKDRDNDKRYYEYFQEMDKQKAENTTLRFCLTFESLLCEFVAFVEPKTNN